MHLALPMVRLHNLMTHRYPKPLTIGLKSGHEKLLCLAQKCGGATDRLNRECSRNDDMLLTDFALTGPRSRHNQDPQETFGKTYPRGIGKLLPQRF